MKTTSQLANRLMLISNSRIRSEKRYMYNEKSGMIQERVCIRNLFYLLIQLFRSRLHRHKPYWLPTQLSGKRIEVKCFTGCGAVDITSVRKRISYSLYLSCPLRRTSQVSRTLWTDTSQVSVSKIMSLSSFNRSLISIFFFYCLRV